MKRVRRGIACVLLAAVLSCQILPEWCRTAHAMQETSDTAGSELSTENESADETEELTEESESSSDSADETEESVAETKKESAKETEKSGSSTSALDQLMENRTNPNASGSSSKPSSSGTTSKPLTPTQPEKEIESDSQKDSVGDVVEEKTGQQILKDLWGLTQQTWEKHANEIYDTSTRRYNRAGECFWDASQTSGQKADDLIDEGNKYLQQYYDWADEAWGYDMASMSMKTISFVADGYNVYQNVLALQDPANSRTSMQVLETSAVVTDTVMTVISMAATIAGATLPGGFIAASVAVGIASAVIRSDAFVEWANGDHAFLDAVDSFFETLFPWMKTPDGVNCYKPNIYFYTDSKKRVTVRFKYPGLLTTTIPDYTSGWNVLLTEDDRLITEDGEEFTFLFYESVTSKSLFQTEAGYEISAENREELFAAILSEMGFNAMEIRDFIEFWDDKLEDGVDYIMYPQDTETVDLAMPIIVNPMPESIERIWFVFEEDAGQSVEEPEDIIIERDDEYALVEWGGMIFE